MGFRIDAKELNNGLSLLDNRATDAVEVYARTVASDFEAYAKQNRPWTDRTSRARIGLTGYVQKSDNGYRIAIAHTVDYGVSLEYKHNRKYAILEPTVRLKGPEALEGLENLLNRLGISTV